MPNVNVFNVEGLQVAQILALVLSPFLAFVVENTYNKRHQPKRKPIIAINIYNLRPAPKDFNESLLLPELLLDGVPGVNTSLENGSVGDVMFPFEFTPARRQDHGTNRYWFRFQGH
jgi:hypothetical protein